VANKLHHFTSGAQKDPFCSYIGGESRTPRRHWSIASSMTFCPMVCHTLSRRWHSSSTSFTRFS